MTRIKPHVIGANEIHFITATKEENLVRFGLYNEGEHLVGSGESQVSAEDAEKEPIELVISSYGMTLFE